MTMKWGKITWLLLILSGVLFACDGGGNPEPLEELPAQKIYKQAEILLKNNLNREASDLFSKIERLYPYSKLAKQSLIMSAVANHQGGFYVKSREDSRRYLDFYPADKNAARAQYLIALSYYDQIDNVSRDQSVTFEAIQAFRNVIERYPDSEYSLPALLKFDLSLDHLAGKEMEIGRYYQKRGHFGAAIERFRVVVEEFQTTSHTPEALHRLVESYLSLGLNANAQTAGAILGHNFQSSDWYKDTYILLTGKDLFTEEVDSKGSSWLNDVWRRVGQGKWL